MKIKIVGIELNDWIGDGVFLCRSAISNDAGPFDYVGFISFQNYSDHSLDCWLPSFGGRFDFLKEAYAKSRGAGKGFFPFGREDEAKNSMDKFLRKMSGLVAFI